MRRARQFRHLNTMAMAAGAIAATLSIMAVGGLAGCSRGGPLLVRVLIRGASFFWGGWWLSGVATMAAGAIAATLSIMAVRDSAGCSRWLPLQSGLSIRTPSF